MGWLESADNDWVDVYRDSPEDVHVSPTYGRAHVPSWTCWCIPLRDAEEPLVWVHREEN